MPTNVVLSNTNISYFDMQAGINYAYFPKENLYLNAGYSVHHVNRPKESFFEAQASAAIIPLRHIGFVNAIVKLGSDVILQPNIYYTQQANASELTLGTLLNYNLAQSGDIILLAGVYYRNEDAVIPMLGFYYHQIKFTFSYDATISSLKNYNQYKGAGEFSIIKNGFYGQTKDRQSLCPSF
jgi:type IX secretion system PorP/SprF family membrane protein